MELDQEYWRDLAHRILAAVGRAEGVWFERDWQKDEVEAVFVEVDHARWLREKEGE